MIEIISRFGARRFVRAAVHGCAALVCIAAHAQGPVFGPLPPPRDTSGIRWSAHISSSFDYYNAGGISYRQPGGVARLVILPTLTLSDDIQIPAEIYLSNVVNGYQQPFNQVGINPHMWGWLTLHGGYFSTRFSELTFGDLRVLGGGIDMTPGKWRIAALYGVVQQARNPDSLNANFGLYKRTAYAGTIGYGVEEKTFVSVNVFHSIDNAASIMPIIQTIAPTENLVATISFHSSFDGLVRIYGEAGASAFSNSVLIPEVGAPQTFPSSLDKTLFNLFESIFKPRSSTEIDEAGKFGIAVTPGTFWNVHLNSQWIGPGFTTLGYPQLMNDVFQTTLAPDFRLLRNKLFLRGSFGWQVNNLINNRSSTTRRIIGSLMANATVNDHFGFDVQYSNYGMKSNHVNDTLRIDNIYQSLNIAPRLTFTGLGATHSMMLSYNFQDVGDNNPISSLETRNQSQTVMLVHSMFLPSSVYFTTTGFFCYFTSASLITRILNLTETYGRQLIQNHLSASLTLGYGLVNVGSSSGQLIARLSATWMMDNSGALTLYLSTNNYQYSVQSATQTNFQETQASLVWSLNI